nr:uncharacterized protein LOC109154451 [Ipomoea batatas]
MQVKRQCLPVPQRRKVADRLGGILPSRPNQQQPSSSKLRFRFACGGARRTSRGSFVSTSAEDAEELIGTISLTTGNWYNQRESKGGLYEVSTDTASQAKMEALGLECGGAHGAHECTSNYEDGSYEQVDAVGYQRPNDYNTYGNNNNQNWRQENWGYQYNQNNQRPTQGAYRPPTYQGNNQPREEAPKESFEDKVIRMFGELKHDMTNMKNEIRQEWKQDMRQEMSTIRQDVSNLRQEHHTSLRNLETQVAQNSKALTERPQGSLPSTTVNNPRERAQAVTLRSGKELPEPILKKSTNPKSPIEEEIVEEILEDDKEQEKEESSLPLSSKATQAQDKGKEKVDLPMYQPLLPFPGRVRKNIDTTQYGEIKKTDEEREKFKFGENLSLDARSDARPVRVQGSQIEGSESCLMDARADARVRPASIRSRSKFRDSKIGRRSDTRVRPASDATAVREKKKQNADAIRTRVRTASDGLSWAVSRTRPRVLKPNSSLSSSFLRTNTTPKIPKHLYKERVEELQEKGVSGGFYFDYALLDAYGCREEVERMMSRQYWERLFSWRDDTYEPVVHEFIATFEPLPSNHYCTPSMKFNLFGRGYQLSIIQLGERLGLYTHEETMSEEWSNLPTDFDSDAAAEAY